MEEILHYLKNIKSELDSTLNFEKVILSNEDLFLKYPDLFYFTALNISYNEKNNLKEIRECINHIIKNKDRFKCSSHIYFTIMNNFICHVNKILMTLSYNTELNYPDLKLYFEILPSIFDFKKNDNYIEKCKKLIELIPHLLETNQTEFKSNDYNALIALINNSIKTINEKINMKSQKYIKPSITKIDKHENKNVEIKQIKQYTKKKINIPQIKPSKKKITNSISMIPNIEDVNDVDSIQNIIDVILDEKPKKKIDLNKSAINEFAEIFYNKMSVDTIKIECYNDNDYYLELIGSYSLSTLKNKSSSIDFVFMKKDENNISFISKDSIKEWIENNNTTNYYLLESYDYSKPKILFYNLITVDGNGDMNEKNVNIYLFCNKYIECNNIFKKIFKDNKNFGILYSFFYLPLINLGLEIGSQICFLIVAFLDIEYKIFHTKEKEKITKYSYEYNEKQEEIILKKTYYYYQLNEKELKQAGKKNCGILINEFNNFLIKIINKLIEIPERLYDNNYLFRIKFFFDLMSKKSFQDNIFQKIEKEMDSSYSYKEFCEKIGLKYEF